MDNIEQHNIEQEELKVCYRAVFNTAEGQRVLDDLKLKGFYNMTTYYGIKDDSNIVMYREGGRNLVLRILSQLQED